MKKRPFTVGLCLLMCCLSATFAKAQTMTFKTSELHYATCPSPDETMKFTWDEATGKVIDFYWMHGTEEWYLYTATPVVSEVVRDSKTLYDYHVYLYVTTKKYASTAYAIRGRVMKNVMKPNGATFGGIYEGTGVAWISAAGTFIK